MRGLDDGARGRTAVTAGTTCSPENGLEEREIDGTKAMLGMDVDKSDYGAEREKYYRGAVKDKVTKTKQRGVLKTLLDNDSELLGGQDFLIKFCNCSTAMGFWRGLHLV